MSDLGYSTTEARCGRLPSRVRWIWWPSVIGKHKFPSLMTPCHAPGVTCLPPDEFPLIPLCCYCWYLTPSIVGIVVCVGTPFCLGPAPNPYLCSTILSLYTQPSVSYIVKTSMSECITRSISLLTHVLVSSCNNVSRGTEMMPLQPAYIVWALKNMVH